MIFIMDEPIKWSKDLNKSWFYDDFFPWGFIARERRRFKRILSERAKKNITFDGNEEQLKVHSLIAPVIKEYFEWKNDRFLVNDDISPLVYEYHLGLSLVGADLILFLEEKFKFEIPEDKCKEVFSMSYGDFINYLISQTNTDVVDHLDDPVDNKKSGDADTNDPDLSVLTPI